MSTLNCHRCGKTFKSAGLTKHIMHCVDKDRKKKNKTKEVKGDKKNIIITSEPQKVISNIIVQRRPSKCIGCNRNSIDGSLGCYLYSITNGQCRSYLT